MAYLYLYPYMYPVSATKLHSVVAPECYTIYEVDYTAIVVAFRSASSRISNDGKENGTDPGPPASYAAAGCPLDEWLGGIMVVTVTVIIPPSKCYTDMYPLVS